MELLRIENLHVAIEGKEILHGIDLTIDRGDVLALLGPNGHGKSTLLYALMGNPSYQITQGKIYFNGEDITDLSPDLRSKKGLFLAFQNPMEVPGVQSMDFFKQMVNAHRNKPVSLFEFYNMLEKGYKDVGLPDDMNTRFLNSGFSGGEKKRCEIMQLDLLKPSFAMLDEIDSGLDVDAINLISNKLNSLKNEVTFLIISHYARLFNLIKPNKAAVVINGKIACQGDSSLVKRIDEEGYEWIQKEYGISVKKEDAPKVSVLGTCANKVTK